MAGKFINTEQKATFDVLTDSMKNILKNPYYKFSDKKGTVCQYYNINTTKTTLDEATRGNYSELGPDSPIRYNKVKDTVNYDITFNLNKVDGQWKLESPDRITLEKIHGLYDYTSNN